MRVRILFPTALVIALGAGCVRFQPKPLVPEQTAASLENRTLAAPEFRAFLETNLHRAFPDWPLRTWDFDQLTLAAFYYHPSLDVARADWNAAAAGVRTAHERPNPAVTASLLHVPVPDAPAPWVPALMFDLPIETAGKRRLRTDQARHVSESARLNIAATAWQVRSHLRSSLLDYTWAQQRVALLQRQVALQQDLNQRFESQLQAGAIARLELSTARIALARSRADLADAHRQLAAARVNVADAVGLPNAALDGLTLTFGLARLPDARQLTSADARQTALLRRTDILGALADYAASQSALQLEVAKQYPDINLSPGYSWNAGSVGEQDWQIGVTSLLPLFNRHRGPLAEAAARRDALAARFLALQAKVIGDLDRAIATFRASETNAAVLDQLAQEEATRQQGIEAQFRAGAVDRLEVLSATLEHAAAELIRLDALAQAQQAFGQLEDAVQSPLTLPDAALAATQNSPRETKSPPEHEP